MAARSDNGGTNNHFFGFRREGSSHETTTMDSLDLSRSGTDFSQNYYFEPASLSETDLNVFQHPGFQETKHHIQSDWSDVIGERCKESALYTFGTDTPTQLADSHIDYGQIVSAELEDLTVQSDPPTELLPDDLQLHTWNYGTLQEQPSPVTTHERSSKRTKKTKAGTSKFLTPIERHGKVLERNRVAAAKCRQKRKEWTTGLEDRSKDLQQERNRLCRLVTSMKSELLYLKSEILRHSMCNNPGIRAYLDIQASKLAGMVSLCTHHNSDS